MFEVVARGTWLYDTTAPMPVLVIEADFDFWFEVAATNGELEVGETPQLNSDGKAYYLRFKELDTQASFWPDGISYLTAEETRLAAQARVPSPVTWT